MTLDNDRIAATPFFAEFLLVILNKSYWYTSVEDWSTYCQCTAIRNNHWLTPTIRHGRWPWCWFYPVLVISLHLMNFWTPRLVKSWLISPIQSLLYVLRHDNWKELHNFRNVIDCCKCQNIQIDFGFPAMKKLHRLLEWRKLSQLLELSPLFVSKYNRLHLFLCRFCIG